MTCNFEIHLASTPTVTVGGVGTAASPFTFTATGTGSTEVVQGANSIAVTGAGTAGDPYVVDLVAADATATPAQLAAVDYPNNIVDPSTVADFTFMRLTAGANGSEMYYKRTPPLGGADWVPIG